MVALVPEISAMAADSPAWRSSRGRLGVRRRTAGREGQHRFSDQPFRSSVVIGNLFKSMEVSAAAACCVAEESFPAGMVESPIFHLASATGEYAPSVTVRQAYEALTPGLASVG
jgi:hypothetical protein